MATALQVETVVLPGGKIEISTPQLPAGKRATVVVRVEDTEAEEQHLIDLLTSLPGHWLFQSVEEVDTYLREERERGSISVASTWQCLSGCQRLYLEYRTDGSLYRSVLDTLWQTVRLHEYLLTYERTARTL